MAQKSSIEWTEATWNPVTGCTKISPGCKFCYAKRMADRLQAMGQPRYRDGFAVRLQEDLVELPLHWKRPRIVFVNSMSDLFHKQIPDEFILRCFRTMNAASWHTFQVLTKRPERAAELATQIDWTPNIWLGASVENPEYAWRSTTLSTIPSAIRFLSVEPLLAAIPNLPLDNIDWAIVGGESGPGARAIDPAWVRELRDQCLKRKVPFFFKQWGGVQKKRTGRILDGRTWDQMPLTRLVAGRGKKLAKGKLGRVDRVRRDRRRASDTSVRTLGAQKAVVLEPLH